VDNICLCSDAECIVETKFSMCEHQPPTMKDDGSGADITIPSYLIFKEDADRIKTELSLNHPVQIEMSWNLPTGDSCVRYDLWTTPSDVFSFNFIRSFKVIAEALGDHAYFTPHMYIWDGIKSQCQGQGGGQNNCENLCTNYGRYCSTNPDADLMKGVTGADLVRESLRRLCIWSKYGVADGTGVAWWEYVATFNERCAENSYSFISPSCIQLAYKVAKIDGRLIDQCMADSGDTKYDGSNSIFDEELAAQGEWGVVVIPTAFVNANVVRDTLHVNNVLLAICSAYDEAVVPKVCTRCAMCFDPVTCIKHGFCWEFGDTRRSNPRSSGMSTAYLMIALLMLGIFAPLYLAQRKAISATLYDRVWKYIPKEFGITPPEKST
jgi:hypothetical protein